MKFGNIAKDSNKRGKQIVSIENWQRCRKLQQIELKKLLTAKI